MKTRALVSVIILILVVLTIVGSCATRKKAIPIEEALEIRSGIWVNEHYQHEKLVVQHPDGRYEEYSDLQQEKFYLSGKSDIYESWRDSDGVLWYRAHYQDNVGREGYMFVKISNSDNTFEWIQTEKNKMIEEWKYPVVGYAYYIYYRQE